jgi:hypothetical protein
LGDGRKIYKFFGRALRLKDHNYLTRIHYAKALAWLGDAKAEEWYKKAIEVQPEGNIDALAYYAEWLLDQGREADVLQLIRADEHIEYLHFLRGVALERLGKIEEAKGEYAQFVEFSADFPAPAKYRIEGSEAQRGIVFEGEHQSKIGLHSPLFISAGQARKGLSYLIRAEAGGETQGGMRAVGWTVRTRVFRGSQGCCWCVWVDNSGNTLADKYRSVICQSPGGFAGACDAWCANPSGGSCLSSPTSDHVAYDVYYGLAPDPVAWWCPAGEFYGHPCNSWVHCLYSSTWGASYYGPMAFHSQCPTDSAPFSCSTSKGLVCRNGYPDNCFYNNPTSP